MSAQQQTPQEPVSIDAANAWVWHGTRRLDLAPKAFTVLRYLVEHTGRLVTKDELYTAVWGETIVGEAALVSYIRDIRKALGDSSRTPRYIETVHKRGFRFIGKVVSQQNVGVSEAHESSNWRREVSTSFHVSSPKPQIPTLVGRDAELVYLHQLLGKVLNGERHIVFVSGEAGIGKTTLVDAFLREIENWELGGDPSSSQPLNPTSHAPHPAPWIGRGQCIEQYGAGEAFMPLIEIAGQLC